MFDLSLCFPVQFHFISQRGFWNWSRGLELNNILWTYKSTFSSKEHKAFSGVSGCEGKEPEVTVPLASVVLLSPWWRSVLDRLGLRRGEKFQEAAYLHSVFLPPQAGVTRTLLRPATCLFNKRKTGL